jgi:hypothetical protein
MYGMCFMFGAFLLRQWSLTLVLSQLLASMLAAHDGLPLVLRLQRVLHPPKDGQREKGNENELAWLGRMVAYLTALSVASLAVPLDWNVSWQRWPVPHLVAAHLLFLAEPLFGSHLRHTLYCRIGHEILPSPSQRK